MALDPSVQELYAAREALAARHNYDLSAIVADIESGPSWQPVKRPARALKTAQLRFDRLVDDPIIREIRAIREKIMCDNGFDIHKIAEAARKGNRDHASVTPSNTRKLD
jgi:hypothetical protein